jgi:hypothetical protein
MQNKNRDKPQINLSLERKVEEIKSLDPGTIFNIFIVIL